MSKLLLFTDQARASIKNGMDKLAEAVKVTMGPKGRSVILDRGYGSPVITEEGIKNIVAGNDPIAIRSGIEKAVKLVVEELKRLAKPVRSKEEIAQVATISSLDPEVGKLISEVMEEVGNDGVVTVEEGQTICLEKEVVKGMRFDKGYVSPYMLTNSERMEAELSDPYILLTDQKISAISDILPLLEKVVQSGKKEILLIADEVEGRA